MNKPKLIIKKSEDKYDQCNFCLSKEDLHTIKGDRLAYVLCVCSECMKKIGNFVSE